MWSCNDITHATGGATRGQPGMALAVSIDSRKLQQGALFVALRGERFDGHDYIQAALANGAAAALVDHVPKGLENAPLIVVADTSKALVDLALAARARAKAKIIAVTGSVGKTGTKDAIRAALSRQGKVHATQGNLNNHIGLPLSLANLPPDADYGVFELGMNHAGEIAYLTQILKPDIAVITNIEAVHLEFFSGLEGIADAKAEIMEGMDVGGTVILNRDNAFYERLAQKAKARGISRIVTFGAHAQADCRLVEYQLMDFGSQIEASIDNTPIAFRCGTAGRHWALTALAALAAAMAAGASLPDAAAALEHFHEPEGRGKIQLAELHGHSVTIIDDCYNASPVSMRAGLAKLAELHEAAQAGRTIAVLGDMLELGDTSAQLHAGLLTALQDSKVDKLYAAGKWMKHLYDAVPASMQGAYAADSAALTDNVLHDLEDKDIVLIKGSRGSRMDIIRDQILSHAKGKKHAV